MVLLLQSGRCYKAEICHSVPLEMCLAHCVALFFCAEVKILVLSRKSIVHGLILGSPKTVMRNVCHLKVNEKRNLMVLSMAALSGKLHVQCMSVESFTIDDLYHAYTFEWEAGCQTVPYHGECPPQVPLLWSWYPTLLSLLH